MDQRPFGDGTITDRQAAQFVRKFVLRRSGLRDASRLLFSTSATAETERLRPPTAPNPALYTAAASAVSDVGPIGTSARAHPLVALLAADPASSDQQAQTLRVGKAQQASAAAGRREESEALSLALSADPFVDWLLDDYLRVEQASAAAKRAAEAHFNRRLRSGDCHVTERERIISEQLATFERPALRPPPATRSVDALRLAAVRLRDGSAGSAGRPTRQSTAERH